MYKQNIKTGGGASFAEFLSRREALGFYGEVLDRWAEQFGSDNVKVRPYDVETGSINIIFDFLDVMGLEIDAQELELPPRTNSAPRAELLTILRAANLNGQFNVNELTFTALRKRNPQYARSGDLLDAAQRLTIFDRYAEHNAQLARRFLGRDDGALFPTPRPRERQLWETDSGEFAQLLKDALDVLATSRPDPSVKEKRLANRERRIKASLD